MTDLRSSDKYYDAIEAECRWRISELGQIRTSVNNTKEPIKAALMRASVPMLYAHWEGAIKTCAHYYFQYVSHCMASQQVSFSSLTPRMQAIGLLAEFLRESCKSHQHEAFTSVIGQNWSGPSRSIEFNHQAFTDTGSNLNPKTLMRILHAIDLNPSAHQLKSAFIKDRLVDCRHKIAHGDRLNVDRDLFDDLFDQTIELITMFKNDLMNAVANGSFFTSNRDQSP